MSCVSGVSATSMLRPVNGNMIAAAQQQHRKRRQMAIRKTDSMNLAERHNGRILDLIWCEGDAQSFNKAIRSKASVVSCHATFASGHRSSCGSSKKDSSENLLMAPSSTTLIPSLLEQVPEEEDELLGKMEGDVEEEEEEDEAAEQGDGDNSEEVLLRLNIGGSPFLILVDAILRADPTTFLAKFVQLNHQSRLKVTDSYLQTECAYYFQRSPLAFEPVLQYYATGVVHKPPEACPSAFNAELEFWRISTSYIGACCAESVSPLERLLESSKEEKVDDISFDKLCCGRLRRRMWTFLERPGSSLQAKTFELCSTLFVLISVLGLSFGTIPDFQVTEYIPTGNRSVINSNGTSIEREEFEAVRVEHPALFAAPRKLRFALKPLNLVDLLAILPFYLELMLTMFGVDDKKLRDLRWAFLVVRILRVLRVIRIIKLGRFSSGLQTFGMTLQRSQKQLQMMAIVLLTGVVFFSTMIYFLEKDEISTPFVSIPAAYWWCIVTMTTVGYGDVVPATTMGKVIASAAIMSGVLVLALPITIIVDNFIKVAQEEQQTEQFKAELLAMEDQERQQAQEQQKWREKIDKCNGGDNSRARGYGSGDNRGFGGQQLLLSA
uniref:BTB domain-containing protein n=1 Tax=Globodera rostochiensis TaxID=31243 RepID=A0A914H3H6_GLORO